MRGGKSQKTILDEQLVKDLRKLYRNFYESRGVSKHAASEEIAQKFGFNHETIYQMLTEYTWSWVKNDE